jgi:hypothetical protein
MLYTIDKPKGIDAPVQLLQTYLFRQVTHELQLAAADYECYGRIYRTKRDNLTVPEAYIGGNEYREVLFNDKTAIQSFFDVGDIIKSDLNTHYTAKVSLYVQMRLDKIVAFMDNSYRMDEDARTLFQRITDQKFMFFISAVVIGLKEALKDYTGVINPTDMDHRNMHPFLVFRIDYTLPNYQLINQC